MFGQLCGLQFHIIEISEMAIYKCHLYIIPCQPSNYYLGGLFNVIQHMSTTKYFVAFSYGTKKTRRFFHPQLYRSSVVVSIIRVVSIVNSCGRLITPVLRTTGLVNPIRWPSSPLDNCPGALLDNCRGALSDN